ncbi:TlpA disulfide reductase family protein [Hymenobacter weizhouensis]|uniref:TlpA disulfide reductase family protein n=1 Tax=Hymenobacter sp. YIM 151500-1 TaxID=2987689 RepID=UPI0022271FC2|nr:TlpA disulfide reductase family protein [Hymenobacter sp. YIM 151500-1]UYZ63973.1 TlpA family protein disulfide reductase [Hymenobacter sp. YIM 151500-1]
MKQTLFLVLAAALLLAIPSQAQRVAVLKFTDLQQRLARPSDTTYVVNFWATWCAPCVKELPYFEQVRAAYAGQKVKVLLVNLDYASQLEKKVRPFVAKRGLKSEVVLLNEQDPNTWVEKLDATWSGALPFTLLLSTARGKRTAYEQEFTQAELTAAVQKFLR